MTDEALAVVARDVIKICNTCFESFSSRGKATIAAMLQPWADRMDVAKAIAMCTADTVSVRLAYPHIASLMDEIIRVAEPVTVDGPVDLTADIPVEAGDIEDLMHRR